MRSPAILRALAFSALLVTAISGCQATAAEPAADAGSCVKGSTPIADLTLLDDPRDYEGGSTACLNDIAIVPVESDAKPRLPVTVTDSEGTTVTVTDASRILALDISGTIAATVFGLALGDSVVGRDASTDFAGAEELPVVTGSGHTINAEAIIALAPTVIVTDTSIGPKDARGLLRDAGIPVVVLSDERTIDNIDHIIGSVAEALGVPEAGEQLAARVGGELNATLDAVSAVIPDDAADRPRILFLYARGSADVYYIFGADTGADSMIESVGGIDVAAEIGWEGAKPMTAEAFVEASPDIILMMTDGLASVGGIDGLLTAIPAVAATPAGENRRIVDMADTQILGFGPRTPGVIDAIARAIYAPDDSGFAGATGE